MIDDLIGISDLPQRLAFVTLLPARFLAGTFPQARHPCRLSPSLDGGLPLFELFNPSRRSSSAIRALRDAFSAFSALGCYVSFSSFTCEHLWRSAKIGSHTKNLYYRWPKEFLEAGKKPLAGDTAREATSDGVKDLTAGGPPAPKS